MSKSKCSNSSCSRTEERQTTADTLISEGEERFFQSLHDFIEHEKRYLKCPEEGPDELRYITYRSVFNQVITRSTAYKRLLLTIKSEYDDTIRELKTREEEARTTKRSLTSLTLHPKSMITCQKRAAQLRDRISGFHRQTAELQEEIKRQRSLKEQRTWIPGLTVAESEHAEALDRHLKHLQAQRAALLDRKSHSVFLEVKAELDTKLQAAEQLRGLLRAENDHLKVLYKRLRFVCGCLSIWEEQGRQVPLEGLLGSTLENIKQASEEEGEGFPAVKDDNGSSINAELFEDEEPSGVDESKFLTEYLHRFIELFDLAQYEEAALLAARSPRGVMRSINTMDMFKGVMGPPGSVPPLLFFSQALLITAPAGDELSAPLSLQVVRCALQHGASQLLTHAVTQNKLTFSEELGDILTEHAQKNPSVADVYLALATTIYETCGLSKKTALSMCRREDCLWILRHSWSLTLLQLLTKPQQGRAAMLSPGVVCSHLLADPQQQELALQLLNSFISKGRENLEEVMLEDCRSSVDTWTNVASLCSELNQSDLSRAILSILLDQSGTRVLSPDLEGARLMEHVFL
ncbi:clathrin heavy chain linker domain-containing protein 1 isoform X2 [Anabas testudineus]|uniref:clathrin heavy chain linker domain-containing protein 1 isoform X2 n=1 Tax=Anabas testudineus TaxID=64144 RepID=UPI000E4567C0|nr:clathrin heavy chain linker domain-containing protein 1 isoform X2 [Anabas testudineus]